MEKLPGFRIDFVEPTVLLMTWMQVLRKEIKDDFSQFASRTKSIGLLFIEMGIPPGRIVLKREDWELNLGHVK